MHACVCARMCACGFSWIRAHRVEKCVRDTGDDFYDQCCKIYTISSGWIGLKILDKKKSYDCCAIRFVCVSKDPPSFFLFFFLAVSCFFFFANRILLRVGWVRGGIRKQVHVHSRNLRNWKEREVKRFRGR